MDKDIIEQVKLYIYEILRICSAFSAEGKELYKLNTLVGRISKLYSLIFTSPLRTLG